MTGCVVSSSHFRALNEIAGMKPLLIYDCRLYRIAAYFKIYIFMLSIPSKLRGLFEGKLK